MATRYIDIRGAGYDEANSAARVHEATITTGASTLTNKVRVTWSDAYGPDILLTAIRAVRRRLEATGVHEGVFLP